MASPHPPTHPTHHWVRIEDIDLAYILEGPGDDSTIDGLYTWIDEVIDIVEDGLETA